VRAGVDGLQQRALVEEAFAEQLGAQRVARDAFLFRQPDLHHLAAVVPFIGGAGQVQAFVALQPDQVTPQHRGQRARDLGLAGAGFAFQEQRALQLQRQVDHRGQLAVCHVVLGQQQGRRVVDAVRQWGGHDRGFQ
jgi:hypothetical protein